MAAPVPAPLPPPTMPPMIAPTTPPCTPRSMTCACACDGHRPIAGNASDKAESHAMRLIEAPNLRVMMSSCFRAASKSTSHPAITRAPLNEQASCGILPYEPPVPLQPKRHSLHRDAAITAWHMSTPQHRRPRRDRHVPAFDIGIVVERDVLPLES